MSQPLNEVMRTLRQAVGAAILLSAFANLASLTLPLYSMQVYDRVLASRNITTLMMLTGIALFMLAVHAALDGLRSIILIRCSAGIDRVLSHYAFSSAPRGQAGAIGTSGMRDTATVRDFIAGGFPAFLDLPWVPLFILLTFSIHHMLGVVTLIGAIVSILLAAASEMMTREAFNAAEGKGLDAERQLIGMLRDPESVSVLGMRDAIRATWRRSHDAALAHQTSAGVLSIRLVSITKFSRLAVQVAVLAVSAHLVLDGAIQPGVMFAATLLVGRALAPIEQAVGCWRKLVAAHESFTKLRTMLAAMPVETERLELPPPAGRLSAENLCVTLPGVTPPLIRDINMAVGPGEMLLVVGPSGAGKTTLVRALLGLQMAGSGVVRLDGAALSQRSFGSLARHVGYVAQDAALFEGTVAQNIARCAMTDSEAVIAAARAAGVHDDILRLPQGYDTEVGPFGEWLSGGMRQRIALARALYGDPRIILLDEPNSQIDAAGDHALAHVLSDLKTAGKTLVVVSHKTGLIPVADKILVMAGGIAQAFGGRDEVLQSLRPRVVVTNAPAPAGHGAPPVAAQPDVPGLGAVEKSATGT